MKSGHHIRIGLAIMVMAALAMAGSGTIFAAQAAPKKSLMNTYRAMMARKCRIKQKNPGTNNSIFNQNIRLSEKWIRIRHVQKGWKGWVRVHAVCQVPGGTAWGYADLQLKSGEAVCESENWNSMITPPVPSY